MVCHPGGSSKAPREISDFIFQKGYNLLMGRSNRQSTAAVSPQRGGTSTLDPAPLPSRESILLELEDGHITYFSPDDGKMIYIDAGLEITTDADQDDFQDEIRAVEERLLQMAKQQLRETGEIGIVATDEDIDTEIYLGPSADRLEQRWREGSVSIEGSMNVHEDSDRWQEDNPRVVQKTLAECDDPRAKEALKSLRESEISENLHSPSTGEPSRILERDLSADSSNPYDKEEVREWHKGGELLRSETTLSSRTDREGWEVSEKRKVERRNASGNLHSPNAKEPALIEESYREDITGEGMGGRDETTATKKWYDDGVLVRRDEEFSWSWNNEMSSGTSRESYDADGNLHSFNGEPSVVTRSGEEFFHRHGVEISKEAASA